MKKLNIAASAIQKPPGFTLVELIIVIGFFGVISAILMGTLLSVYQFKDAIRYKKELNFEASSFLNNGIPGLLRSGFSINYANTRSENRSAYAEGFQNEVDQISIFSDRAETQYFTIYRKDYQPDGEASDTAPLYIAFSNGDEFPLHSSEVVVEDFDIKVPKDPRLGGDPDIQPYVSLYLRVRHRYPFGQIVDEEELKHYQKLRASYQTTITLRNSNPESYKTLTNN